MDKSRKGYAVDNKIAPQERKLTNARGHGRVHKQDFT